MINMTKTDDELTSDRRRVLSAAGRLFYSRGIQSVGMDAVRSEAGIPLKRIYAQFPSKEALLVEVLRHHSEHWLAGVDAAVKAASAPRAKLLAVFDFLSECFEQGGFRGCVFINAFGELGAVAPEVARAVQDHKHAFQAQMSDLVAELDYPAHLGPQLALLVEGAQSTAAIEGSPVPADIARRAAVALIDASG
jgi:AcrR family transcriptional regulator